MATQVQDILNPNWQMSPYEFGEVLVGEDDIKQCIKNIVFTRKGDVPFAPDFGTNIIDYIDKPLNKVAPLVVSEVTSAVTKYEKRVKVTSVSAAAGMGTMSFTIYMVVVAGAEKIKFNFDLDQIRLIK